MTPEQRYDVDPNFRRLVDTIKIYLKDSIFDVSEFRQAAMLACTHQDYENIYKKFSGVNLSCQEGYKERD